MRFLILFLIPTFGLAHTFINFGIDKKFIQEIGLFYTTLIFLSVSCLLLSEKLFKKNTEITFISITVFSIAFFSFLPIDLYFSELRLRFKLLIWLVFTAIILTIVLFLFRKRCLQLTVTLICLMYATLIPSLHASYINTKPSARENVPNVYFLMPDSYASPNSYSKYFGYSNSRFMSFLAKNEFHLSKEVYVNYPVTTLAVSSMLDSQLFVPIGDNSLSEPANYEPIYRRAQGNNKSAKYFTARGYNYIHYFPGVKCDTLVTYCLGEKLQYTQATKNFLKLSALEKLISNFDLQRIGLEKLEFEPVMHDIKLIQSFLENEYKSSKPLFLFARILPPHSGNTYGEDCLFKAPGAGKFPTGFEGAEDFNLEEFIRDTKCTERDLIALVGHILNTDKEAIIVIQSDGGPDAMGQFDKPYLSWNEADIYSRFSAFRAIRSNTKYKSCIDDGIKKTITTVNTLKIIMSCLSREKKYDLSDDTSFFASYLGRVDHGKVLPMLENGNMIQQQ